VQQTFIVSYDIADPKRLRLVFKLMKGWGDHLQFSVFRCDLSPSEVVELQAELKSIINSGEDQVLFIDLGPADGRALACIDAIGLPCPPAYKTAIVV
jgi:CRISPR-associated protein Cas2